MTHINAALWHKKASIFQSMVVMFACDKQNL